MERIWPLQPGLPEEAREQLEPEVWALRAMLTQRALAVPEEPALGARQQV
jgi:hypothetical protein